MITTFFTGFGTGAGLIIAIGAQNAFVLSQGIRKKNIFLIPLICAICDAILILAGVAGMGTLIERSPFLIRAASWGGASFLFFYGLRSFKSAYKNQGGLDKRGEKDQSRGQIILMTLAITLLNPHVYLDTVVLLGSMSGTFPGMGRYYFGIGALTASFIWFFSLSLGAVKLAPLFRKARTWQILDVLIGIIMWIIAFKLIGPSSPFKKGLCPFTE